MWRCRAVFRCSALALRPCGLFAPRVVSLRSCSSERPTDEDVPDLNSAKGLDGAKRVWQNCLGCIPEHRAPQLGSWQKWIGRKVALYHVKALAANQNGEGFETLEDDILQGAPQCLQYLNSCLGASDGSGGIKSPVVEQRLIERLDTMANVLKEQDFSWSWDIESLGKARIDRVFIIIGTSRSGALGRGPFDLLGAFGQQFVLAREQTDRFIDRKQGLTGRMAVFQELLLKDMVLVVDVVLPTKQRSSLREATSSVASTDLQDVDHTIRLEMALTQERSYDTDDDFPVFSPSPWLLVDWNGLCLGNHPALLEGEPSPW